MAERSVEYLLVGGGMAGGNCARWLRESGADGEILLIAREPDLPYNRPPLSKGYLQGKESKDETLFRGPEWYEDQSVEALTRVSATKLDLQERTVALSNGQTVGFGKLLLATGANVRRLNIRGCELEGIHYLRTLSNSDAIREDAAGKRVVLIGGSYIGCEVAATLTELGSQCTIVMLEAIALSRTFGEQAGRFFQQRLEEHGVQLHGNEEVDRFEGSDGRVTRVITKSGLELEAEAVVIGAGVMPDVALARDAGLTIGEAGGVQVDSRLESSVPGIYAAGDIAEYESVIHAGRRIRIEHWDVAFNHGKTAAQNMLGSDTPHQEVPYFFSDLSDWASLEYVGPARDWDQEVTRGSLEEGKFTIWYLNEGSLAAALSVGRSDDLDHARRFITEQTELAGRTGELEDVSSDLAAVGN